MAYISWFSDIGLYLEDYFMYKAVTLAGGIREPLLTCSSLVLERKFIDFGDLCSIFNVTGGLTYCKNGLSPT